MKPVAFVLFTALSMPVAAFGQAAPAPAPQMRAEVMLKSMLDQVSQGQEPTYENVTPEVAAGVHAQPEAGGIIAALGPITDIEYLGAPPGGHLFRVSYATAKFDWLVAMNAEGKFDVMYFHPSVDFPTEN